MHHETLHIRELRIPFLLFVLALLATVCGPVFAADRGWQIEVTGLFSEPDVSEEGIDGAGDFVRVTVGGDPGIGLGFQYRFSRWGSLVFGAVAGEHDLGVEIDFADGSGRLELSDDFHFVPLTAGLRFHLTPGRAADVTFGAGLAYVFYGDLGFENGSGQRAEFTSAGDLAWNARLGIGVPFGDGPWSFVAAAEYLDSTLELTDRTDGEVTKIDFDPILLRVGVAYRFK